jgi:hypothetical protein
MATTIPAEACAGGVDADQAPRALQAGSDAFCPECGQSLRPRALPGSRAAAGSAWRAWLLVLVGAGLFIAFGGPAWGAAREAGGPGALPHLALSGGLGRASPHDTLALVLASSPCHPSSLVPTEDSCLPAYGEAYWYGRAQLAHDLPRLALGVVLVLAGLGAFARRGLLGPHETDRDGQNLARRALSRLARARALGDLWELVEGGLAAFLVLALATWGYFLVSQARAGAPLTAELAVEAADRTIDAWSFAVATLGMFLRAPVWHAGPGGT